MSSTRLKVRYEKIHVVYRPGATLIDRQQTGGFSRTSFQSQGAGERWIFPRVELDVKVVCSPLRMLEIRCLLLVYFSEAKLQFWGVYMCRSSHFIVFSQCLLRPLFFKGCGLARTWIFANSLPRTYPRSPDFLDSESSPCRSVGHFMPNFE